MENVNVIENADIVLTGVALSDIYINKDHLIMAGKDIGNSNKKIQELLNTKTENELDFGKDIWKTEIANIDVFTELSKSHSAYNTLSKREYLAVCQLGSIEYHESMKLDDRLNRLEHAYEKVKKITKEDSIKIEDIEIRFYEYGNVTITGVFRIRDKSYKIEEYQSLSDFAHIFFGASLRKKVSQLITIYRSVMKEVDASTEIDIEMLNVPLEIDVNFDKPLEESIDLKYVLDFSIRYHIIYNSKLKALDDFVAPFHDVLNGEWEHELKNQLRLKKASIYFGWTHSLVILDDYNGEESIRDYESYRFPLEVVLTNWGALHSLSKRLEKGRAMFLKEIDDEERYKLKSKKYHTITYNIREFSLKVKRILQSLDSYTVTNNPMHYKLIEKQQEVFLEHRSVERINRQLELVENLVDELSEREKIKAENRLNKVLTILTLLTILDISKTIHDVSKLGKMSIGWISIISTIMLIILLITYKYEPRRKRT